MQFFFRPNSIPKIMEEIVEVAKLCLKREFLELERTRRKNSQATFLRAAFRHVSTVRGTQVDPEATSLASLYCISLRREARALLFPHRHVSRARMVQTWRKRTSVESHRGHGVLTCSIEALRCVLRSTHGCVQNCVHSCIRRLHVAP